MHVKKTEEFTTSKPAKRNKRVWRRDIEHLTQPTKEKKTNMWQRKRRTELEETKLSFTNNIID